MYAFCKMIMSTLKGLTIVAALLTGGTSLAMAQSVVPWEYRVAPGVFVVRPGYGVAPGYIEAKKLLPVIGCVKCFSHLCLRCVG